MKAMITSKCGSMDTHLFILKCMNKIYSIDEKGSNGGHGYYWSHAEIDYSHITIDINDTWYMDSKMNISKISLHDDDILIHVETIEED